MKKIILGTFLLGVLMPQLSYAEVQCNTQEKGKDKGVVMDQNACAAYGGVSETQECGNGKTFHISMYNGNSCDGFGGLKGDAIKCKDGTQAPDRSAIDAGFCQAHGGMEDRWAVKCKDGALVDSDAACARDGHGPSDKSAVMPNGQQFQGPDAQVQPQQHPSVMGGDRQTWSPNNS